MANPTVTEIVEKFLKDNGYDGLIYTPSSCSCQLSDLMPCGEENAECRAGYKITNPERIVELENEWGKLPEGEFWVGE